MAERRPKIPTALSMYIFGIKQHFVSFGYANVSNTFLFKKKARFAKGSKTSRTLLACHGKVLDYGVNTDRQSLQTDTFLE